MPAPRIGADLHRSAWAFQTLVWPVIRAHCGGGSLVRVESDGNAERLARMLDEQAGIDYLTATPDDAVWGIAQRVQFVRSRPYNTFTMREVRTSGTRTELAKRMAAFGQMYHAPLLPSWTVQAYVTDDDEPALLSAAAIWTTDLLAHVRWGHENVDWWRNATANASFVVVPWSALASYWAPFIWRAED